MLKNEIIKKLKDRQVEIEQKDKIGSRSKRELLSIGRQLDVLTKGEVFISDHARIRYLERIKGMDIEALDREILPVVAVKLIKNLGVSSFKLKTQTHKIVIEGGILKTVVPPK